MFGERSHKFHNVTRPDLGRDEPDPLAPRAAYRDAYRALAAADPAAVRGLPDPDGPLDTAGLEAALEAIRLVGEKIKGVPPS